MLKHIHLKNFRQHQNLTVSFSDGITVVRGANEAGKTTLFEAITFALFGVKACRNNDLTTWGEPAASHQVEVTLQLNNLDYTIKRSAKAAQVDWEGGRITGQTEVTRFCEELLELKPNMGNKLMFVPQNAMRGVLEEGGAKTTALIEKLADFNIIENWIDTLQEHFPTGNTVELESTIQQLTALTNQKQEELDALTPPDVLIENAKTQWCEELKSTQLELQQLEDSANKVKATLKQIQAKNEQIQSSKLEIKLLEESVTKLQKDLDAPIVKPSESEIENTQNLIKQLEEHSEQWADYQRHRNYKRGETIKASSKEEVEELHQSITQQVDKMRQTLAEYTTQINHLNGQICNDLACPTCKREWVDAKEKEQRNQELLKQIEEFKTLKAELSDKLEKLKTQQATLQQVLRVTLPEISTNSCWRLVSDGLYPPTLEWTGQELKPFDLKELQAAKKQLDELKSTLALVEILEKDKAAKTEILQNTVKDLEDLQKKLSELGEEEDTKELADKTIELLAQKSTLQNVRQSLESKLDNPQDYLKDEIQLYHATAAEVVQMQELRDTKSKALKSQNLNNALLKALRRIKPQIATQIWQTVCSVTAHYFSMMRGQESAVTKTDEGFTVDGNAVSSLSGSTLDILGIAIRVALTRTFMPSTRFLFLDEPFAACDSERQEKALGFIHSLGFEQIIIVTHEDTTEAVADNLIAL